MSGHRLIIKILVYLALSLATVMVALNLYPSWSRYARSLHEPLLLAALSAISSIFLIRSFTHRDKDEVLLRIGRLNFRVKHMDRAAGFLFIGVLCTPVTHPAWYIRIPHFVFTGTAIATVYITLLLYYKTGTSMALAVVGALVGISGLAGALLFQWYPLGLGELIAAVPISIHILISNRTG